MSLYLTDILAILETTEDKLLDKIKRRGKTFIEAQIKIIERALLDKKYFVTNLDIDKQHLRQNIRRMLMKTPPVSVTIAKTTPEQLNMSVDSVDLNVSSMSYEELESDVVLDPLMNQSKKELVRQLKLAEEKILAQDSELQSLRPLGNFFKCESKRGGFSYMPTVDRIAVGLLSKGESSLGIVKFFEALAT
jgi:hypothetical protein